jgi:aryl-alcohol dehydrogenase-like predicted oxidoreductase
LAELSTETRFLHAIEMGLGAWQWGDRIVWQYGHGYGPEEVREAFQVSVNEGIRFVDTAEIYGNGRSERLLGQFLKKTDQPILIATKFFPLPWRFTKGALPRALKGSLARIGAESVDLYQIHWPSPIMSTDTLMAGLAECVKSGMTRTVGVSNFGQSRMLAAYSSLARHNIPLASNQVHYSYSPLEKGLLSGKYSSETPPPGSRGASYSGILPKLGPLLKLMTEIGQDHGGKSNTQIALNWTICKGALPIPGAKNAEQAQQNAGALGWKLTDEEVAKLDEVSDSILE